MADITAQRVKELRDMTGLGMMECKKALTETGGDIKAAEDLLRIKSGAKASKAAGRVASEGAVAAYIAPDGKTGALVEVNCETDFVAKNAEFLAFARTVAERVAAHDPADVSSLSGLTANGGTVEDVRRVLVGKIGENMTIRRFTRMAAKGRL